MWKEAAFGRRIEENKDKFAIKIEGSRANILRQDLVNMKLGCYSLCHNFQWQTFKYLQNK
jgi:hypothetical protein